MEDPRHEDHERAAQEHPDDRRQHDERQGLDPLRAPGDRGDSRFRDCGAGVPADQRMRRARRQTVIPGDQVPGDGAHQAAEDHVRIDDLHVDHAAPDGLRHRGAHGERGDEVEERRPDDRLQRAQDPRTHDRGDGVRRVVKAVDEVEDERDRDDRDDVSDHAFFREMLWSECTIPMQLSIVSSRWS